MSPLPYPRPKHLSLGPLEREILHLLWELGSATVKEVHDRILADPNRELAYASVTTVLRRLTTKGWLACDRTERSFRWYPLISREEATILQSHDQLHQFLSISNPDVVAAFADSLDSASVDRLDAIAQRIKAARQGQQPAVASAHPTLPADEPSAAKSDENSHGDSEQHSACHSDCRSDYQSGIHSDSIIHSEATEEDSACM